MQILVSDGRADNTCCLCWQKGNPSCSGENVHAFWIGSGGSCNPAAQVKGCDFTNCGAFDSAACQGIPVPTPAPPPPPPPPPPTTCCNEDNVPVLSLPNGECPALSTLKLQSACNGSIIGAKKPTHAPVKAVPRR